MTRLRVVRSLNEARDVINSARDVSILCRPRHDVTVHEAPGDSFACDRNAVVLVCAD